LCLQNQKLISTKNFSRHKFLRHLRKAFLLTVSCTPKRQYLYCNQRKCRRHQRHLYIASRNLPVITRHRRRLLRNSRPPLLLLLLNNNNNKLCNEKEEDRKNQLTLLLNFLLRKCLLTCVQGHKFNKQFYLKNLLSLG
jgi:hypothetical protein